MQKNKATVYLIAGFIGAGKTIFSRKLESETGALRFTKDEWMVKVFGNNPKADNFAEFDELLSNLATEIALKCAARGVDVIIDDGFWYKKQREDIIKQIKNINAVAKGYYLKCPKEILEQRVSERSKQIRDDSFVIDNEMFANYYKMFEEPDEDEGFEIIDNF